MSKASESGRSFIDGVLAKLPENLREAARTAFQAPEAEDALALLGDGTLARSDYSRKMDELQAKETTLQDDYTKLNGWYTENQAKLAEYDTLKAGGIKPIVPATPAIDTSKFVSAEDFNKSMMDTQRSAANYLALQTSLTLTHYKDFGEVLDTTELLADPNLGKAGRDGRIYGLVDAYHTKFADKLTARDQSRRDLEINKLVDEKVAERMKGVPNLPMPIRGGGSPLDALDAATDQTSLYSADAAAAEYARLQGSRQGA